MDVCPTPFKTQIQLPLSPNFTTCSFFPPNFCLQDFDQAMDQTVLPDLTQFEVVLDGVPETPTSVVWTDADTLTVGFATTGATTGILNLLTAGSNLRGVNGATVKPPQSCQFLP